MVRKNFTWVFVIFITLLPVSVFGIVTWYQNHYSRLPVYGKDHRISDFRMYNQYNEIVNTSEWKNKITVTNFFFTHCPVICPKMTRNLKTIAQEFSSDKRVLFNSFTVDPARDSVKQLASYALRFKIGNHWNLLTGNKIEIYRLARESFKITATDGDGGANDFIHSDKIVLVDPLLRIRGFYDGINTSDMQQLKTDIRKLEKEDFQDD